MQYSGITLSPGFVISAATDPQFNYVTALLHGDGTNAGQNNTFLDSSINNFTITRNGSTTQGSLAPYSTLWSNFLNTGDKLTASASSAFDLSGSTWTIEFWMYSLATPTSGNQCRMLMAGSNGDAAGWDISYDNTGYLGFYRPYGGGPVGISTPTSTIALNTWYHVAFVCNAGSARIYINGVSVAGPVTISLPTSASQALRIGYDDVGTVNFQYNGYLSNLRIVKGTAVYTAAFTPPTAPLTAITNTSFLTCQSNRFKDNSTNNLTITPTATPSVQVYSPFGTTTQYDPNVNGGSGYFNGSTDYLSLANNAAFQFGTGDFTVELYYYPTALTGAPANYQGIIGMWGGGTSQSSWLLYFAAGSLYWYTSTNGSTQTATLSATSGMSINNWYHIALVRSSGTTTIYVNGTSIGSTATVVNLYAASCTLTIGYNPTGGTPDYVYGYLSNIRIVKGTAVYTTNFTPPTIPVTAIANTSLLLSGTNGQIYDNAMMSNFVTVGNAQISTSVVKYGTGSISFNGSTAYLTAPTSVLNALSTGDFTIEAWVYTTNLTATNTIIDNRTAATASAYVFAVFSTGALNFYDGPNNTDRTTSAGLITTNSWYHVAATRSGTTLRLFVNGVLSATFTGISSDLGTSQPLSIGRQVSAAGYFYGYMDELRITKGYARYTSNFTAPTSQFPSTGNILPPATSVDYLVVAGGGAGGGGLGGGGGGGGFVTGSSNVNIGTTYTVTVGSGGTGATAGTNASGTNGAVSLINPSTNLTYSGSFDGSSQYLSLADNTAFNFGTGDATVEYWFNSPGTANNYPGIISSINYNVAGSSSIRFDNTGYKGRAFMYINGGGDPVISSTSTIAYNAWNHIAIVRQGTSLKLYLNGALNTTVTISAALGWYLSASGMRIGRGFDVDSANGYYPGYISNVRLVKGVAVYTGNFTVPTSPLTATQSAGTNISAITGTQTSLLTLQNSTFIDNSTNAFTITNNGTVTTTTTNPPLATVFAYGGGGGGTCLGGGATPNNGRSGGSAGGGSGATNSTFGISGAAAFGQGNAGGIGVGSGVFGGGGGGGAGAAGATGKSTSTGVGGDGTASSISGSSVTYAGGGGGGSDTTSAAGGAGGGGASGNRPPDASAGTAGTANTGGGGGAGSGGGANGGNGANGGSGIVIIRYSTNNAAPASTTGSPTVTSSVGYNIYTWTSSGSITF
jgi:hypothetical protein